MTNILDNSYESDITEEEHERLILMSEHAIAKPISPAAQAVLDAFRSSHTGQGCLAAALRSAAENFLTDWDVIRCCDFLLDMADELEAQ